MKHIKKHFIWVACLLLVVGIYFQSNASQAATKKNCFTSNALTYQITGKNTACVTGVAKKYSNSCSVSIPKKVTCNGKTYKVTSVSSKAFKNCKNLNKISCSSSLNSIVKKSIKNSCSNKINLSFRK